MSSTQSSKALLWRLAARSPTGRDAIYSRPTRGLRRQRPSSVEYNGVVSQLKRSLVSASESTIAETPENTSPLSKASPFSTEQFASDALLMVDPPVATSPLTEVPSAASDPTQPQTEEPTSVPSSFVAQQPEDNELERLLLEEEETEQIIPPEAMPPPRSRPVAMKKSSAVSGDSSGVPVKATAANAMELDDPVKDRWPGQKLNIYEMDSKRIAVEVRRIEDLEELVAQVERMPQLLGADVPPLVIPLSRLTSLKQYGQRGAELTQRLLLTCLSRLPVEVKDRYSGSELTLPYPPSSLYTRAAIAWASVASKDAAERAEMVFQLQLQEYLREREYLQSQTHDVLEMEIQAPPPDRRMYKSRLRAWAISKEPNSAAKAYDILCEMEMLSGVPALLKDLEPNAFAGYERDQLPPIELEIPDIATYNVVLSAFSKERVLYHPTALEKCKKIVQRIENIRKATLNDSFQLDAYSYVSLLKAYERWVFTCQPLIDPKCTTELFDIIKKIHAHIQTPEYIASQRQQDEALTYKRKMDNNKQNARDDSSIFFPLSFSWVYGLAVDALLKTQPLPQNILLADDIVVAMTGRLNRINKGSTTDGDDDDPLVPLTIPPPVHGRVWPRDETLMGVVHAWEKSGLSDSAQRLERLLYIVVVEQQYSRIYYLHVAMNKWCELPWKNTPELIEAMLGRSFDNITNERKKPTGQTFAIAMKAWLRSKTDIAPQRAELLLQRMLKLYEDTKDTRYKPEEVHLRYVLSCWLNLGADGRKHSGGSGEDLYPAEHCENIVMWLVDKPWASKLNFLSGQVAMAIRAWAVQGIQSGDEIQVNPMERAVKLVNLLGQQKIPSFPCNWVLEVCRRRQPTHDRKKEAYNTAVAIFNRSFPNARTYVLIVQVLRVQVKTLQEEHQKVIEELFKQACTVGLLSQDLVWHFVEICPAESLQRVLGLSTSYAQMIVQARCGPSGLLEYKTKIPHSLDVQNMPAEWCGRADTARIQKSPVNVIRRHP